MKLKTILVVAIAAFVGVAGVNAEITITKKDGTKVAGEAGKLKLKKGDKLEIKGDKMYVIKGSDTIGAKLAPQLAEVYKQKTPDAGFEIAAEGSSTGVAAVIDNTCDIGMSSREAKDKEHAKAAEKNVKLHETTIAFDGIAVIVNEANPLANLTLKQIEGIFTGETKDWSEIGGKPGKISAYTRNTSSGTYSSFAKLAMSKKDYGKETLKQAGNEAIVQQTAGNPNGIGYVGLAYIKADGIKVVGVDGVKPEPKTINDKSYPIARPLYYYTNGAPEGKAKSFIDFTLSAEGQKIVAEVGFVPLTK